MKMADELMVKQVNLTVDEIKKYICPNATDQEAYFFLQLCKAQGLNPFLREAYLIKYDTEKATIVTGKDTFTKRADRIPSYDGFKAGIILLSNKQVTYREGSFMVQGETLLGGWAEVFRKDKSKAFRNEVSITEYERRKKDGSLMSNWKSMPATMIRKVALVQSLREAFPDEFGGIYSPEEMPIDSTSMPIYTQGQAPIIPSPITDNERPPISQPQETKPDPSKGTETIITLVDNVTMKEGKNDKGKPWTKYTIHIGEKGYSTFDKNIAKDADQAKQSGVTVNLEFKQTTYGPEIVSLTMQGPPEEAPEPGSEG